jgi:hypothetical protein
VIENWQNIAFNQVPHSQNQIHGDEMAKAYGFKGGLVPGVTVSAYLIHPAAVAFGRDYADKGFAHVRVNSPLYDESSFNVQVEKQSGGGYSAVLTPDGGSPCATAEVSIPADLPALPVRRGDELGDKEAGLIPATRENMESLRQAGCKAFLYRWEASHDMSTYLKDSSLMAPIFSEQGLANPSFVLGVSNWVLANNAYMNPWVHMETRSQNFAAIPSGTKIVGEMVITDLFDKKGHEFVDATINLFNVETDQCYTSVELRAIYKLRS